MSENNPGFQQPARPGPPPPHVQSQPQASPYQQQPVWPPPPVQPPYGGAHAPVQPPAKIGVLSIITLIASFFIGYLALIVGIFALRQNWVKGTRGNGMAWAGIIVGAVFGTVQFFILYTLVNMMVIGANVPEF